VSAIEHSFAFSSRGAPEVCPSNPSPFMASEGCHADLAKAGAAASSGPAGKPHGLRGSRTQNIENNPMQSSSAVAGMRDPAKTV
jgi:hypothetical protein